jgi:hypothetical protein
LQAGLQDRENGGPSPRITSGQDLLPVSDDHGAPPHARETEPRWIGKKVIRNNDRREELS